MDSLKLLLLFFSRFNNFKILYRTVLNKKAKNYPEKVLKIFYNLFKGRKADVKQMHLVTITFFFLYSNSRKFVILKNDDFFI